MREVIGQVHAGRVMIDGLGVGDIGTVVLRDRKHLSEDGMLVAVTGIDSQTGDIVAGPDIVTRGFVYARKRKSSSRTPNKWCANTVAELTVPAARTGTAKSTIRTALNRFVYERTKATTDGDSGDYGVVARNI